ncbi:phosphatase PAP2 family protein [Plesiomonas shigelloides subsp. oncorhynchi]|nr:phosphatase PAP2 family protein [Plesiomonas shigelloides]
MFSLGFYLLFSERTVKEGKLSGKTQSAWLILLLGVAISWARVFLGVHFPFDILGAIPVSLLAAYLTWRLASYLCPPRRIPPQRRT